MKETLILHRGHLYKMILFKKVPNVGALWDSVDPSKYNVRLIKPLNGENWEDTA